MIDLIFYKLFNLKSKKNILFFILTALVLLVVSLSIKLSAEQGLILFNVLIYPFTLISNLLRTMSLSSNIGNIIAFILFILMSIIPLIILMIRKKRKTPIRVGFYLIISCFIGLTLYLFINPSLIPNPVDQMKQQLNEQFNNQMAPTTEQGIPHYESIEDFINKQYGNTNTVDIQLDGEKEYIETFQLFVKISLVSVIGLFIMIYLAIQFYYDTVKNKINLYTGSKLLLIILKISYIGIFILTFSILPAMLRSNLNQIDVTQLDGSVQRNLMLLKYLFIYSTIIISYFIIRKLHDVLVNFTQEKVFSQDNVLLLHPISIYFIFILLNSLLYQFISNVYQLINTDVLQNFNSTFNIPITELILALAFYLLSLYMKQSYKIYKENQLTI